MAQLKFYRKATAPTSPVQGTIWFNTSDKTIQIYTGSDWEKYAGNLKDATWSTDNKMLTITKHDGSSIALNFSDMASATVMGNMLTAVGLDGNGTFKHNTTNYGTDAKSIGGEISAIDAKLKSVSDLVGATSVDSQITTAKDELIGTHTDQSSASTISGAKNHATSVAKAAEDSAKEYTDEKIQGLDVTDTAVTNEYVSSVSETDGKISVSRVALPVTGVAENDKVLSLTSGKISSDLSLSYVQADKKIYLYGIDKATPISTIDATDFVADSFLDDVDIDANDNITFTWKMADGSTKTDSVNISKYIDTYTSGNGISLSNKEFSVDTSVIATKQSVDNLDTQLNALAATTVNGKKISMSLNDDVTGTSVILSGADINITGYSKANEAAELTVTDTINVALGKLEAKADKALTDASNAASAGVTKLNDQTGDIAITTGLTNGTIKVGNAVVAVKGLGSAAYTESTNYATSAQGAKADTAIQNITTGNGVVTSNYITVTDVNSDSTQKRINVNILNIEDISEIGLDGLASAKDVKNYVDTSITSAFEWAEF